MGDDDLFHQRLSMRHGHFFDPHLLPSQSSTFEQPQGVLKVNAARTPAGLVFGSVKQSGAQAHPTERGYSQSNTQANARCYGSISVGGL